MTLSELIETLQQLAIANADNPQTQYLYSGVANRPVTSVQMHEGAVLIS